LRGDVSPLQSLLYLSRKEKLSRNNKRYYTATEENCPETSVLLLLFSC
jgi:hypothetical protein